MKISSKIEILVSFSLFCFVQSNAQIDVITTTNDHSLNHELIDEVYESTSSDFHFTENKGQFDQELFITQNSEGSKYIAHCEDSDKLELRKENAAEKTLILIGPESDFSANEIEMALQNQFQAVSLGVSRLRTETPEIVAVYTINMNN